MDVGKGNSASCLPESLIYFNTPYGDGASLTMNKCTVRNNAGSGSAIRPTGNMTISDCTFTGNNFSQGIFCFDLRSTRTYDIKNCTFTDNPASINYFDSFYYSGIKALFTKCTFNNNGSKTGFSFEGNDDAEIKFTDCDMGNSTYKDKKYLTFVDTSAPNGIGSIFSEGSLTMIFTLLAFIISIASIGVTIAYNKKKPVSVAAEPGDEEQKNS